MSVPHLIIATLTGEEHLIVTRRIVGSGGHQGLLRKMLTRYNVTTKIMTIRPQDLATARHYAAAYGKGGYQDRFAAIVTAAERAGAK